MNEDPGHEVDDEVEDFVEVEDLNSSDLAKRASQAPGAHDKQADGRYETGARVLVNLGFEGGLQRGTVQRYVPQDNAFFYAQAPDLVEVKLDHTVESVFDQEIVTVSQDRVMPGMDEE